MKHLIAFLMLLISFGTLLGQLQPFQTINGQASIFPIPAFFNGTGGSIYVLTNFSPDENGVISYDILDSSFRISDSFHIQMPLLRYTSGGTTSELYPYVYLYISHPTYEQGSEMTNSLSKGIFSKNDYSTAIPILGSTPIINNYGMTIENPIVGFKIVNTKGNEITSLRFPTGYTAASYINCSPQFFVDKGKIYNATPVLGPDNKIYTLFYDFGNTASVSSIKQTPKLINIHPTIVPKAQPITIELPESDELKTVEVVDSKGVVIYRVVTSDNSLQVNSSILPIGLNIVNVTIQGHTKEATKIFVK